MFEPLFKSYLYWQKKLAAAQEFVFTVYTLAIMLFGLSVKKSVAHWKAKMWKLPSFSAGSFEDTESWGFVLLTFRTMKFEIWILSPFTDTTPFLHQMTHEVTCTCSVARLWEGQSVSLSMQSQDPPEFQQITVSAFPVPCVDSGFTASQEVQPAGSPTKSSSISVYSSLFIYPTKVLVRALCTPRSCNCTKQPI